jgi:hypothetical protein
LQAKKTIEDLTNKLVVAMKNWNALRQSFCSVTDLL